ncbi:MAG: LLM class flavin-dependent oxidoreductase [Acidimicrobiia bacterium]|nr:LLM class flavin-dependent oxidoreductase [Acidimicrobiia bacterium]
MSVGVIGHVMNPTRRDAVAMAVSAESAGADWIGLADAFWWRDVWMLLENVAAATSSIEIGPAMTNPYLRHPFHTASALATLQELAGPRTFVGIAAGGSEVTGAAGVQRLDAPAKVAELVDLLRGLSDGRPLDRRSGRQLDIPIGPVPILVTGRGSQMLRTAGAHADRVLLWSIPDSDLDRSVAVVQAGAAGRDTAPELAWAPLVAHDESTRRSILNAAVYASINTAASVRESWGLTPERVEAIRAALVGGGTEAAIELVPRAALDDLVGADPAPDRVAARGREIGATSIVVPCYDPVTLPDHITWARAVERRL